MNEEEEEERKMENNLECSLPLFEPHFPTLINVKELNTETLYYIYKDVNSTLY